MVLEPTKPKGDPKPMGPLVPVSEHVARVADQAEKARKAAEAAASQPPAAIAPVTAPPVQPPPAPPEPMKVRPKPQPAVPPPAPPAQPPAPPVAPAAEDLAGKARAEEEAYVASLLPEQQDEIALATFAERNGKPGMRAKTLEYFKKLDTWVAEHPNAENDEVDKFRDDNAPRLAEVERRRLERKMIVEEARAEVRKELAPEVQENARRVRRIEIEPVVSEVVRNIENQVTTARTDDPTWTPVDADVVKAINEKGYAEAVKSFPVEAPIVQRTCAAARAWHEINHGVVTHDPENVPIHKWLGEFIAREGQNMLKAPADQRTLPDGRTFLPIAEFYQAMQADPAAASRHWTFDDRMVTDMLAHYAVSATRREISRLETAGFERKKKTNGAPPPPAIPPPATANGAPADEPPPSPRATSSRIPGADEPSSNRTPAQIANEHFMKTLVPTWTPPGAPK